MEISGTVPESNQILIILPILRSKIQEKAIVYDLGGEEVSSIKANKRLRSADAHSGRFEAEGCIVRSRALSRLFDSQQFIL